MSKKKNNFFFDNRYLFISFGATAGLMLIVYICTQVFPFGDNTVLRMDLYHQYGPLFSELYDRIFSGSSLSYSWVSGLGSCFLGNYFNYLSSPIGAIVVFFGHSHVPEAIAAMVLIKAALSSATFAYYIKKSLHNQSPATVAFGILYSFCAYMLAYYWNIMWLDAMVLLPLILLGIERILDHGKIGLYTGALALSLFSNYYMSYMLCLFSVIYFFYYSFINPTNSKVISAEYQKKHPKGLYRKLRNSRFFHGGVLFAGASLLAAGLMAFALIPTYKILQNCSATSGSFPSDIKTYFTFFDFFANHFGSLTTTIRSSGEDVLPNVYCGIITIILAILFFFTKSISKKEKFATIGLLTVFFISFNFNFLNFVWHGMHFPNDLPYRFSFMYSFILLVMAYKTFLRLNEISSRQIGLVGALLVLFVAVVEKVKSKNVGAGAVYITLIFIVLYVLLLTVLKDKRFYVGSLAVLLCICVCSEVIICDTGSFPNSITRASYEDDYDDFRKVKDTIDSGEKDKFYRMELTYLRTRMDNCWFGYNGVSVFSSMAYEKLSKLEDHLGLMSNRINSYNYDAQTPVYNMMHALKYVVNNTTPDVLGSKYYKRLSSVDKFTAYQNNYYLPLAYCVDSAVEQWNIQPDLTNPDPFEVQGDFFKKATGENADVFVKVPFESINYTNVDPFTESLEQNDFHFSKSEKDTDASATFSISAKEAGNYYVYYYVDGGESKDITVNSPCGTFSSSTSFDCLFDVGTVAKNQTITVTVPFEKDSGSLKLYVYRIDDEVFERGYNKLAKNTMNITSFEDTDISGTFSAEEDCLLYTSIPYDKGWTITLDGKEVAKSDIIAVGDALIGIRVSKGNHKISFSYQPVGLMAGIMISAFVAALTLLILIIRLLKKKFGKKKTKKPVYAPVNTDVDNSVFYEYSDEPEEVIAAPQEADNSPIETVELSPQKAPEVRQHLPEREVFSPDNYKRDVHREVFAPTEKPTPIESVTAKEWNEIFGERK